MIEWNIQSRAHACQACGQRFADRQKYHTLLFDEKQGYARLDVCEGCWEAQFSQGAADRKGFVSYWQGTYVTPPPAPPEPIAKDTAEALLRKLVELNNPQYRAACFILAVMLERKRILKVQSQGMREGQRVFVYEHPKTGDVFTIVDANLQLDQLDQVQRDVASLLEQGLNPFNAGTDAPSLTDGVPDVPGVPVAASEVAAPARGPVDAPTGSEPSSH
jgi:hypothetical protein